VLWALRMRAVITWLWAFHWAILRLTGRQATIRDQRNAFGRLMSKKYMAVDMCILPVTFYSLGSFDLSYS